MVIKRKNPSRQFTDEFKREAIGLGKKIGTSKADKELGVNEANIRQWHKKIEGSKLAKYNENHTLN